MQKPAQILPKTAAFAQHTPETVLEHVVAPLAGFVLGAAGAARRLQHGRVQAYLFYLLAGVGALAAVVAAADAP